MPFDPSSILPVCAVVAVGATVTELSRARAEGGEAPFRAELFSRDRLVEYARSLAEFNANNALWLNKLRAEGTVKILKFADPIQKELYRVSKDVVAEAGATDELSKKVYASYQQFLPLIIDWSDIAEGAFLNSRRLV